MAKKMKPTDWIAISLLIVGGINWGLYGVGNFFNKNLNLVNLLLNKIPWLENTIYALVGLGALYSIYSLSKIGRR